jgi:hypothetical protein
VDQDATGNARKMVLAIAKAVGSTRAGVVELTFQQETEGDNFEEQILYGGAIHLMKACFRVMVENGYPPSFAYAKAIRSLRSVIDVMDEHGIEDYLTGRAHARPAGHQRKGNPQDFRRDGKGHFCPRLDAGMEPGDAHASSHASQRGRQHDGGDRKNLAEGIWEIGTARSFK